MTDAPTTDPTFRLAPVLGALSMATDLADGHPPEKVLRTVTLAMGLARAHGIPGPELADTYYTALLLFLGCTAYAPDEARLGAGEDIALRRALGFADGASRWDTLTAAVEATAGRPLLPRLRGIGALLFDPDEATAYATAQCEVAVHLAGRLHMPSGVLAALAQKEERADGRGAPRGLAGGALTMPIRVVRLAHIAETALRVGGPALALETVRRRRGTQCDPELADRLLAEWPTLFAPLETASIWQAFLDAEPAPYREHPAHQLGALAETFGCFADLKSAWMRGHSMAVADLALHAAGLAGFPAAGARALWLAALLHDLGRVSVPNAIWDKPGPLELVERERVASAALHTRRILERAPPLAGIAELAAMAGERYDGSGHPRGLAGPALPREGRLLAAADVYVALTTPRAWRAAFPLGAAAEQLRDEARRGRLCADAVQAVLAATGQASHARRSIRPLGLSARELDVLRPLAQGRTNKEIAATLGISARTVGHHIASIFTKTGVTTRAGASLVAMEHRLLDLTTDSPTDDTP